MSSRHHLRVPISSALWVSLLCLPVNAQSVSQVDTRDEGHPVQGGLRHPVMHPDFATRELWRSNHQALPRTALDPVVQHRLAASVQASASTSMDLFADLTYAPSLWDQGQCGSCWVFASTAMLEVALSHTYGIKDFLSIQYLQSNATSYTCTGGDLTTFTSFYNSKRILVPWSNPHAEYLDGAVNAYCSSSLVSPALIGTAPSYPITQITPAQIDNTTLNQTQMIQAIKAALNQGQAVGFSFFTDFDDAGGFYDFWDNQPEATLWINPFEGGTWSDATWGGHMITIMGYNEDDPDPTKHYWIVRNQWGLPTNRPNGQIRLPMQMNYGATFQDFGQTFYGYQFETLTLTMVPPASAAPTATILAPTARLSAGQPLELKATVTGAPPLSYQWRRDGSPITGATSALYTVAYLNPSDGGHSYDVVITNASGTTTANAATFTVNGQQLLVNPGFEDGDSGAWVWNTSLASSKANPFRNNTANPHGGAWYTYLGYWDGLDSGNTGLLEEPVNIPTGAGSVSLGYWVRQLTGQTPPIGQTPPYAALDTLTIRILDASGNTLRTLRTYSNQNVDRLLWTRDTFDLGPLKGQSIRVQADWSEKATNLTAWRLDDLALTFDPGAVPVIALAPTSAIVAYGGTQSFTPTVTYGSTNTVTWAASAGGTLPLGATVSGAPQTYRAPGSGTSDAVVVATVDTPVAVASAAITLVAPSAVTVSVSPSTAELMTGSGTQQFTATVSPLTNGAVTWSGPGVNASGTLSATGLTTPGAYTVTATSVASPTSSPGTATVSLVSPASVSVAITPPTTTLTVGGSQTFTATVTGPSQTANRAVTWSVNGGGTTTPGGLFTATTAGSFTLTATNTFSGVTGTATVHVVTMDLNGDKAVDPLDLLVFAKHYGTANGSCLFSGDSTVSDADLALLLASM
jgi:Papain family cysteine protease